MTFGFGFLVISRLCASVPFLNKVSFSKKTEREKGKGQQKNEQREGEREER